MDSVSCNYVGHDITCLLMQKAYASAREKTILNFFIKCQLTSM